MTMMMDDDEHEDDNNDDDDDDDDDVVVDEDRGDAFEEISTQNGHFNHNSNSMSSCVRQ